MTRIGFIGCGTVGTALAVRLSARGYKVVAATSRTRSSAERLASMVGGCRVCDGPDGVVGLADVVFVTTPDDAIPGIAANTKWRTGQAVLHCSGADSVDTLEPAREKGALVGGFHPLQTFASIAQAIENIPGSTFALEAEEPLLTTLKTMAGDLGGNSVVLGPGDKVLYHAAAVMASNYFVTLVKLATDLWQKFGVSTPEATRALIPLLRGTVNNIENVGLPHCLTGPLARGDVGTVKKHLEALEKAAPDVLPSYRYLALQTIPVALGKGRINQERAEELRRLLSSR